MAYDYDLLILGAGSAGLAAAKQAVRYTTKVALIEQEEIGGVCVNRGCIAKKLMVYAADFAHAFADAEGYGWSIASASFNWQQFIKQRDQEIQRIRQVQQQFLLKAGIDYIHGHAVFIDPHTVEINESKITADRILIAVGGIPAKLDIPGIDYAITSREMFQLQQIPERLAVIGGGYIGVEFASLFQALGSKVTLMNHEACILTGFDQDLQTTVHQGLNQRGIQIFCNTTAKSIQSVTVNGKDSLQLELSGDCNKLLTADTVLCATGRTPNLQPLQLENAGIEQQGKAIAVDENSRTSQPHIYAVGDCTNRLPLTPVARAIAVDENSRTSQPHIYAVGDCTNRLPLTPVARAEGQIAVDAMFGKPTDQLNYGLVPSAVFSRPEAAAVGLTEVQAREQYGDKIEIRQAEFYPLFDRLSGNHLPTLSKQIFATETKQLIGLHLVVTHAAEIIQGMSLAMRQEITETELDQMIGIHPTSAEELFG